MKGRHHTEKILYPAVDNAILTDVNLNNSTFKLSSLSNSSIIDTHFDSSTIIDTIFTFSNFEKSSFVNCKITASLFDRISSLKGVSFSESEFNDVFFVGSDLTGADFQKVKGQLLPVHFYEVRNFKEAKFDEELKAKIEKKITEDEFIEYVTEKSELSKQRKEELLQSLDELRNRKDYFKNAAIAYAYLNKKDAKLAARAAWIVASENTQKLMSEELSKLKKGFEEIKSKSKTDLEREEIEVIINELSDFEKELKGLKRTIDVIKASKKELSNINQKYLDALEKGNANIFKQ